MLDCCALALPMFDVVRAEFSSVLIVVRSDFQNVGVVYFGASDLAQTVFNSEFLNVGALCFSECRMLECCTLERSGCCELIRDVRSCRMLGGCGF